jgi:hypothetical protein
MRTILTIILSATFTINLNAQFLNGSTPGSIYYDQGNVTIGASTSNTANLHIGKQEAPANTAGEVSRLSIQPYGHTGALWIFRSRDIPGVALLDMSYGTTTAMTFNSQGGVGVGTLAPAFKFHVRGSNPNTEGMALGTTSTGNFALTSADGAAYGLFAGVSGTGRAWLQAGRYDTETPYDIVLQSSGGNVLIGKFSQANTSYRLDVNGKVRSNEIVVNADGADFVFDDGYALRDLAEVERYLTENNHLPDIESAEEMQKNGLELGKMDMKLLQKIEELTLYMIALKKEMNEVKSENQKLKNRVADLEKN